MGQKTNNRILWHGNVLNAEGKAVAPVKAVAGGDGTDGLNEGELYICNSDRDPALFILTDAGNVVRIDGNGSDTYTRAQINEKLNAKVDVAFFSRLFGLMDEEGGEIQVNDVETLASSIKAKLGFWTEQYISALGLNPSAGSTVSGATTLAGLEDVSIAGTPGDGQVLAWDAAKQKWVNKTSEAGLDETALAQYLVNNNYVTQSWLEEQKYATQQWVTKTLEQYVTAEDMEKAVAEAVSAALAGKVDTTFFARLLAAIARDGTEISVNDMETAIASVKVKFGLWGDSWISAKGQNPDAGGSVSGATDLGGLTDVTLTSPQNGQVLAYNGSQWVNKTLEAGLDETALAQYLTDNLYATQTWVNSQNYATEDDLDARIDALVNGAPAAFDTLKEIADVLQGNVDSIGDILMALAGKADKTITITAGAGLTGGGDLSANRTMALATVGTAGTYTKVTVDAYGRVTGHSSLAAGDIPTLSISKITGLQSALDAKLDAATFNDLFEKVEISTGVYAIRAKYGLYSNDWISAKGANPDAGGTVAGASSLEELSDVSLSGLQDGQVLAYDTATQKWVNKTIEGGLDETALAEYLTDNGYATQTWAASQFANKTGTNASGTWPISIKGNASTSSKWATARKLTLTGDVTGSVSMDGSKNVSLATEVSDNVFTYRGRVTASGPNPTASELTDATLQGTYNVLYSGAIGKLIVFRALDSSAVYTQIYHTYAGSMMWRSSQDSTLSGKPWRTLLDTNNYTSYLDSRYLLKSSYTAADVLAKIKTVDGSGSGLDADTLDGRHETSFMRYAGGSSGDVDAGSVSLFRHTGYGYSVDGWKGNGGYLSFGTTNYVFQIQGVISGDDVFYRRCNNGTWRGWKQFAFTDSNVESATQLQTARTINGTSFNGTANITTSKWGTARSIYIRDASQAHTGSAVSVDGSANEYLLLPSTITATLSGNASTASKWATARKLTLTGDVTGSVSMDGSKNVSLATEVSDNVFTFRGSVTASGSNPTASELTDATLQGTYRVSYSGASGKLIVFRSTGSSADYTQIYHNFNGNMMWRSSQDATLSGKPWRTLLDTNNYTSYLDSRYLRKNLGIIGNNKNLNDYDGSGLYFISSTSYSTIENFPTGSRYGYGILANFMLENGRGVQWYIPDYNHTMAVRTSWNADSWGDWDYLLTNRNYPNYLDSRYVNTSGDMMTGALTVNTGTGTRIVLGSGIQLWATAADGWARTFAVYNSSGESMLTNGSIAGAYGTANTLYYTYYGGTYNSPAMVILPSNKYVGIGTASPSYKLHVAGVAYASTGLFSDGYVSAKGQNTSSDLRLKTILSPVRPSLEAFAKAPLFRFAWKSDPGMVEIGSSAQYWKNVLPDTVKERDGWLEMGYGNIALAGVITIARDFETLEQRVDRLEKENGKLKKRIKELERRAA